MKRSLSIVLLGIILLSGCSSGKKQLEQGDYYSAVIKSSNRLKKKSDHKKSRATLRQAYPLAVETIERDVKQWLSGDRPDKWRNAVRGYQQLQAMYDIIKKTPGARTVISNPTNYFDKLSKAKKQAAEESYLDGNDEMEKGTRESAKNAYLHFQDALLYAPNYKDVEERMQEAKFQATLKVVLEQIPVPTRYKLSADFFQDKVEEFLRSQRIGSDFVAFYTPKEVEDIELPYVDQILRVQFDDFVVGQEFIQINTETYKRDSVEVGEVEMEDGSIKKVYGTVKAKLTIYSKQVKSEGLVSMRIFKPDGMSLLKHDKFNGTYIWEEQWATFNGDERALTEEQLKLCGRKELFAPPPQEMFIRFTEPIYNQLTNSIRQFYSRY